MQANTVDTMDRIEWIFGYGSIIWRVDFPFAEKSKASISGFKRRFWQGSPDHRGTPTQPGRVVTLIPSANTVCEGMAYRIHEHELDDVLAHLDHREQGGYDRAVIPITLHTGETVRGLTYYATPDNPWYLGQAAPEDIASHILLSQGPSGSNIEYLEQLSSHQPHDPHISAIMRAVETIRPELNGVAPK